MSFADERWTDVSLAGVTMNPVRGANKAHYGFVDLCVLLRRPDGSVESVVDCRTRARDNPNQLGEFTADETERFRINGFAYAQNAHSVAPIISTLSAYTRNTLPVSANQRLCKRLLCNAARLTGAQVDNAGVFLLRERSRWIDLGIWRLNAEKRQLPSAERFSGLLLPPRARVEEMFSRLPALAASLGVDPKWSVRELLDWQDRLVQF